MASNYEAELKLTARYRDLVLAAVPTANLRISKGGTMYYVEDGNHVISPNSVSTRKAWMAAYSFLVDAGRIK